MRLYHRLGHFGGISFGGWGLLIFLLVVVPFVVAFVAIYTLGWLVLGLSILIWQTGSYARHHGPADPTWSARMRPFLNLVRERF